MLLLSSTTTVTTMASSSVTGVADSKGVQGTLASSERLEGDDGESSSPFSSSGKHRKDDEDDGDARMTPFVAMLVALGAVSGLLFGYDTGVVSGSMLLVRHALGLNDVWHELIVSATIASAWAFSLCGGYMTDRLGRRPTVLAAAAAFGTGALVMALAGNKEVLLLGRIVIGVGVGLSSMSTPMYIAECSPPRYRGVLVTMYMLGTTVGQIGSGMICAALASAEEGWRWMLGLGVVPSVVLLCGFLALPESPRYLVARGRDEEAERALRRLRGASSSTSSSTSSSSAAAAAVRAELHVVREACEQGLRQKAENSGGGGGMLGRIWRTPHARRALVLGCALQAYLQLAGINTVMYYSATIFRMAGIGSDSTAIWLSVGVAAVNFLGTVIGILLVDRLGRRPLVLVSLLGASISLAVLGGAFVAMDRTAPPITDATVGGATCSGLSTCADCISASRSCGFCALANGSATCWPRDPDSEAALDGYCTATRTMTTMATSAEATWAVGYCPSDVSWVAVLGLVVYILFFAPGMGSVTWVINSEVHALWARDAAASLATSTNWLTNLAVSASFLSLVGLVTAGGAFLIYACIALTGVLLLWFIMPETKGVKLEEIEALFSK